MGVTRGFSGDHRAVPTSDFRRRVAFGFLGSAMAFPRRTLGVIEADLDGVVVERFDTIAQIPEIVDADSLNLQCLAIEEARAFDLIDRFDVYEEGASGASLVLAYSDADIAQRVKDSSVGNKLSFLPMQCALDAWTAYIRLLICKEPVLPRDLATFADIVPGKRDASPLLASLTDREHQVLQRVAKGLRNRCIAETLNVSEHTVKLHLHNCFNKIGVSNRAAAAVWYQSQGLDS